MQELNPRPSLAMHVLHKYIPALILKGSRNGNNQSIMGCLNTLIEELDLEDNHD